MIRYVTFSLVAVVALLALDYYVYRNWRRFARSRRRLTWTLPLYRVLMAVMPLALPLYFSFSRWWEVEPKLARAVFIGVWACYYLPKALIAVALLLKDLARGAVWLFGWFQDRLLPEAPSSASPPSAPPLDLSDMSKMNRAEFLRTMGWTAASLPFIVVGYGAFRTLYDFEVRRIDVPVVGLPRAFDGLTIAQLSDVHAGSFFSPRPMQEVVARLRGLQPDLAVITGDFVNHDAAELEAITPALQQLQTELGVFACLGNHDHYARVDDVTARVRATSVDLLVNEHRTLEIDGARLHVIGTDNTGFSQHFADLPGALEGLRRDPQGEDFQLLLAHDPTFWDHYVRPEYADIDLMLCGHTHGGQIGFELGPLRWGLARVMYERWAGLYTEHRNDPEVQAERGVQYLYVNRGIGTVGPPLRLGIRPEIALLKLRRA